ncbi:class I SAM-dependent methyltransferase [Parafrigoribacterium mesophilum]|uniref:class I SAM-dependent methyltransferase n=1 Tax=Parafrigoribacterium mesophilum TaxID=433646 RepID=UPI0031FDFC5F
MNGPSSKSFWNDAARRNAAWHVATGYSSETEEFFASGVREVDEFLSRGGVALTHEDTLLEIGSGVGRMTRQFAALAGRVIAVDVSGVMLDRARSNLAGLENVEYLEVSGEGELPIADASVDAVFSYITLQHVPTASAQERYFVEALRVLRTGGWVYLQFRRSGLLPRLLDWAGHLGHLLRWRRTLSRAWRGSRISERTLLGYASESMSIRILPQGRRHIWVLGRKDSGADRQLP